VTIITVMFIMFFAHWTCSLISMHAAVLLPGRGTLVNAVHSLLPAEERVSHYFLILPLSFNTNYDGITVLEQGAYRAIILAKILSYSPRVRFFHFLEAFPISILMTIFSLLVGLYRWTSSTSRRNVVVQFTACSLQSK